MIRPPTKVAPVWTAASLDSRPVTVTTEEPERTVEEPELDPDPDPEPDPLAVSKTTSSPLTKT